MWHRPSKYALLLSSLLWAGNAFAQSAEKEPAAVVELGGAAGHSLKEGASSFGPTVAVEVTPVENRLELEAGDCNLRHAILKTTGTLRARVPFVPETCPSHSGLVGNGVIGSEPIFPSSYIQNWIKPLKDDKREIFRAAADAQRIVDMVLGFHPGFPCARTERPAAPCTDR